MEDKLKEKQELFKHKDLINRRIDDLGVYKANLARFKANQVKYITMCEESGKGSDFMRSWAEKRIEFLDAEMQSVDMETKVLFGEVSDIDARLIELMELDNSDLFL